MQHFDVKGIMVGKIRRAVDIHLCRYSRKKGLKKGGKRKTSTCEKIYVDSPLLLPARCAVKVHGTLENTCWKVCNVLRFPLKINKQSKGLKTIRR